MPRRLRKSLPPVPPRGSSPGNPSRSLARSSRILIVGRCSTARQLEVTLNSQGVFVTRIASARPATPRVAPSTRAIVVVDSNSDESLESRCERLHLAHPSLPLFVAAKLVQNQRLEELQGSGVQAVLSWPRDRDILVKTARKLA